MGRRRKKRHPSARGFWTTEHGGMPMWGIAAAVVAILALGSFALVASSQQTPPTYASEPRPVPTFSTAREAALVLPESPRVLMLGDSYMQGTGAGDPAVTAWAPQVAAALGWQATIDGIGGTGFTVGSPRDGTGRFDQRVEAHAEEQFDLVFIEGGQNDHLATPDELSAAVRTTLGLARQQWPDAAIIVMGPAAPQPLGDMLGRIANPIEATGRDVDALTINPVAADWMTAENSPGFDFDGAHVNQAGHDYIAMRVAEVVTGWQTP